MVLVVHMVGDRKKASILMLILCCTLTAVIINPVHGEGIFTPENQFAIPAYNSSISFATIGSYSNASLIDNIWYFTDLLLANSTSIFPNFKGIRFSVSVQNCNLTITRVDTINVFPPTSGWLDYMVSGVGNQTFNLHYPHEEWLSYEVYVDGTVKTQNDGWNITKDGWLTVTDASSNVKIQYKRASNTFTSTNIFNIPECNSSINFAFEGSYVYANLVNNTWRFQNPIGNNYDRPNNPVWYLNISARNCNVTISSYCPPYVFNGVNGSINCTVVGVGTQKIDNNYDSYGNSELSITNYTVIIDGTIKTHNDGWTVSDNGWLTLTGVRSNVSINYYDISIEDAPKPLKPTEPTEPALPDGIHAKESPLLFNIPIVTLLALVVSIVAIALVLLVVLKLVKRKALSETDGNN